LIFTLRARALVVAGCSLLALAACSSSRQGIDYRSSSSIAPLEIPPELTIPTADVHYYVPEASKPGVPSGGGDAALQARLATVLPSFDKVRVEHFGDTRWLVVAEPPEKLWPLVKGFWREQGLPIMLEIPEVGVMETEWGENRLKRAQSLFGKIADALTLVPERDKFRTRFERTDDGKGTEIYISHRGVIERYTYEGYPRAMFEQRPTDTGLEREFLYRLMVRLGGQEATARASIDQAAGARAKLGKSADGTGLLELFEPFDRAWRRVGLVLDRASFVVEDRDRRQGVYFVRYVDVDVAPDNKDAAAPPPAKLAPAEGAKSGSWQYRVQIRQEGELSRVRVMDREGAPDKSATAQRIVEQLYEQLK
jgi:outer membrane protein assembly factor BamC